MPTSDESNSAIASRAPGTLLGTLLAGALLAGCSVEAHEEGPPNVLLICMDTVRADHLGCYGYGRDTTPRIDALAARSLRFEDASATSGWTKPSVPSFLTGTYPCQHGVYEGSARLTSGEVTDVLPDSAETLAEAFRAEGYRTAAFVRNAQLRPGNGFEQGFEVYRDEAGDAQEIRWRAQDWLDGLDGEQPFFLYLHFLDAHWPYPVPEGYATRFASAEAVAPFRGRNSGELRDAVNDGDRPWTPEDRANLEALYDGSLTYLDEQIGMILDGLERRGLGERTVVGILSDHGEEFGEHGRIGHGHGLYEGLLQVPWILHVPGESPRVVDQPVSLVDVFPTMLSAAGLPFGSDVQGIDRLSLPDAHAPIFAEHKAPDRYLQTLRWSDDKALRTFRVPPPAPGTLPTTPGDRWEVEVVRGPGDQLVAVQFKPRDEPADDPIEIKGVIGAIEDDLIDLQGFFVLSDDETLIVPTEGVESTELAAGRLIKVRGRFVDGGFAAERIKLYPATAEAEFELRGTIAAVEGDSRAGRVRIGDVWVVVDEGTRFKNAPRAKARMERSQVLEVLELGGAAAARAGYTTELLTYDLVADPDEQAPMTAGPRAEELADLLDRTAQLLLRGRLFTAEDRRHLDSETIAELQAIGYAR